MMVTHHRTVDFVLLKMNNPLLDQPITKHKHLRFVTIFYKGNQVVSTGLVVNVILSTAMQNSNSRPQWIRFC